MKRKYRIFLFTLLFFMFASFMTNGIIKAEAASSGEESGNSEIVELYDSKEVNVGSGKIKASIQCKYASYIKYGRYVGIKIKLHNNSVKDFNGYIRVVIPGTQNNMYQKQVKVVSHHSLLYNLVFPAEFEQDYLVFSIINENGNVIAKQNLGVSTVAYSKKSYIAVLTDTKGGLDYLDRSDTEVFYLNNDDISSDYKMLDMYDCLVIDNYTKINQLSDKKIKAIEQWVDNGGTLVVSANDYDTSVVNRFSNSLLNIRSEFENYSTATTFGLMESNMRTIKQEIKEDIKNKKIEAVKQFLKENLSQDTYSEWQYEIAYLDSESYCLSKSGKIYNELLKKYTRTELDEKLSLSLSDEEVKSYMSDVKLKSYVKKVTNLSFLDSQPIVVINGESLIQMVDCELGNVIVFETGLYLEPKNSKAVGMHITDTIINNFSTEHKAKMKSEQMEEYNDLAGYFYSGLKKNNTRFLPNLKLYMVLLIFYIVIIGPVIFIIMRKRNRNMLLWCIIPAISIVFSVLIYFLGSSTRIEKPYVNYLSQIKIEDSMHSRMTTYFSATSSKNSSYNVIFDGNRDITPFSNDYNENTNGALDSDDYNYGIEYSAEKTKISMKNVYAFESKDFCDKTTIATASGIICNVSKDNDKFYGNVINEYGFTLKDCFIYDNGNVIYLGNIKNNTKINNNSKIYTPQDYNYNVANISNLILKGSSSINENELSVTQQRKKALIDGYMSESVNSQGIFFYGFKGSNGNDFTSQIEYQSFGVTAISEDITINYYLNNYGTIPDISYYAIKYNESITDGSNIIGDYSKPIMITYKLPAEYDLKGLLYSSDINPEFNMYSSSYSSIFNGTVKAKNNRTGRLDTLFESGNEKYLTDISEYVDEDNMMTLYYTIEKQVDVSEYKLPTLMVAIDNKM